MEQHAALPGKADFDEAKLLKSLSCIHKMAPTWSDERIWSYLRYSKNINVSKKVVTHLLEKIDDSESTAGSDRFSVGNTTQTPAQGPLWQMNMFSYKAHGWADLKIIFVMDALSGTVKGHTFAASCRAWHWLLALNKALECDPAFDDGLYLTTGTDPHPSSPTFMKSCWDLGIHHQITSASLPGEAFSILFRRWIEEKLSFYLGAGSFENSLSQCVDDFNKKVSWDDTPHRSSIKKG